MFQYFNMFKYINYIPKDKRICEYDVEIQEEDMIIKTKTKFNMLIKRDMYILAPYFCQTNNECLSITIFSEETIEDYDNPNKGYRYLYQWEFDRFCYNNMGQPNFPQTYCYNSYVWELINSFNN